MVTISIIGIFSAVVFVSLDGSRKKSRDSVRVADLKNLSFATQRYFSEHFTFPTKIDDLNEYFASGNANIAPKDPLTKDPYIYLYVDSDVNGHHKYCFAAVMESGMANPNPDDPDCSTVDMGGNYIIKGP